MGRLEPESRSASRQGQSRAASPGRGHHFLFGFPQRGPSGLPPSLCRSQQLGPQLGYACACACACSVVSDSLRPHEQQPSRFLCPWDSPSKNTGVGGHFLLQEVRAGLCLTPLGSPRQGLTQGRGSAAVQVNSVRHCLDNPVLVNMKFAYTPRQALA